MLLDIHDSTKGTFRSPHFHFYTKKPCKIHQINFFKIWTLFSSILLFFCRLKMCRIIIQHLPLMLQPCQIFRHSPTIFFKSALYRRSSAWNLGRSIVSSVENEFYLRCLRVSNGDHGQLVEYRFILHWQYRHAHRLPLQGRCHWQSQFRYFEHSHRTSYSRCNAYV